MALQNLYIKYLIRSHTLIGIFVVFVFFISTYFGTLTLFKPYVNSWENLSRHFTVEKPSKLDLDLSLNKALIELKQPTHNIQIQLPSFKEKALSVKYGFSEKVYINPNTNEVINTANDTYLISNFFNQMHINLNLKRVGQILMGMASVAIIFLTISGVYLWFIKRKVATSSKSFWFKWHKDLSLIMLPYILVFSLTGAFLGLMLSASSPFALIATNGKESNMSKLVRPLVFSKDCRVKKSGEVAPMKSLHSLYQKAQEYYPELTIKKITLHHWKDKNACVSFSGFLTHNKALSGNVNRLSISFNAASANMIEKTTLDDSHTMAKVLSGFYFLHFLPDEGILLRILFFIGGLIFAISMIFGIQIWLEKKALKHKEEKNYIHFLSKFSLALFVGVIPSTSFLLFLYWFLPLHLLDKSTWIIGGFYAFWSFTLFYSVYQQNAIVVIQSFLKLNGILLILAVVFHGLRSEYFIWNSFDQGIWEIFYVDLSLLIGALLSYMMMKKVPNIELFKRI